MRIKFRSKNQKLRDKEKKCKRWHKKFAWKPMRLNDSEIVWLANYYRRARDIDWRTGKLESVEVRGKEEMVMSKLEGTAEI